MMSYPLIVFAKMANNLRLMVYIRCVGGRPFFFSIRYSENDHQITYEAYKRNNDASYGTFGNKGECGEQHHEGHDAYGTGFLGKSHAAKPMVIADVFA